MQPTHAERARTIVAGLSHGALSTIARDPAGYPFGSLVSFALDPRGNPLFLISRLAEHTANLLADRRASLLVNETTAAAADPLAGGRVTLLGDAGVVDAADTRQAFLAAHPEAEMYVDFPDFAFWRLDVQEVRYVGGFGRMSWVSAADYAAAEADPLAPAAADIVAHMNDDHSDAVLAYCHGLAGRTDVDAATFTGVDRYGFDIVGHSPDGPVPLRFDFSKSLTTVDQVRGETVRMVREARERMGAAPA